VTAVREEEVKLRKVGFVKQVGIKPGVKERVIDVQSGESEEEEVMGEVIGASEMVTEWGWQREKGSCINFCCINFSSEKSN